MKDLPASVRQRLENVAKKSQSSLLRSAALSDSVDLKELNVKKDDVIELAVTPNDGILDGLAATATAIVVN